MSFKEKFEKIFYGTDGSDYAEEGEENFGDQSIYHSLTKK